MATTVQNAAKGQKKAMQALYAATSREVYFICEKLLGAAAAQSAAVNIYRNTFKSLLTSSIETDEEFYSLITENTVEYCKKQVLKGNSKAYRLPEERNFLIRNLTLDKNDAEQDICDLVLSRFNELQRLIFVLSSVSSLRKSRLAYLANTDFKTLNMALDAQEKNIEKIIELQDSGSKLNYEKVQKAFLQKCENCEIPLDINGEVLKEIESISAPAEKKAKIKLITTIIIIVLSAACIVGVFLGISSLAKNLSDNNTSDTGSTTDINWITTVANPTHYADIEIKDYGTVTVALDGNTAPITVQNFVDLANSGYYNGLTFHRIMEGFVMQGGDIDGDGLSNGDTAEIKGEFLANGVSNNLSHVRGAISMARSNAYDSASSQFFIVHEDSIASLDRLYAAFGYVTQGMDIVDKICTEAEPTDDNGTIPASAQPVMTSVTIRTAQ